MVETAVFGHNSAIPKLPNCRISVSADIWPFLGPNFGIGRNAKRSIGLTLIKSKLTSIVKVGLHFADVS